MVPKEWERKPIKELCESIIDCVNKTAKHVDYITPYKMIRTTNVRHGKVDTENVRYVDEDVYQQWIRRGAPQDGDIIFTREAPVGEAGILENSEGIFLGQRTMMYRVNPKVANNRFVFYSLMSGYCQKQIEDLSNGGTVAHMRVPDCGEIIINSPPLPEQQKIAKILSTWDKAISTTERLIDNSNQQKKALMQQLLTGKKRLLDESGKRFEGEFNQHRLSELVNIDKKSLGKNTPENYEFEYISLSDVSTGTISKSLERHIFSSAPSRARRIVRENDLLLATVRPNLKGFAKARKEHDGFVASTGFAVLSAKKDVSSDYVYHYLFSHHLTGQINALVVGSNYPAINSSDVGSLKILCPPLEEQQKIATVLTNADREIELLEQQLADLQQEKKALMQVLLTGKKRVLVDGEV